MPIHFACELGAPTAHSFAPKFPSKTEGACVSGFVSVTFPGGVNEPYELSPVFSIRRPPSSVIGFEVCVRLSMGAELVSLLPFAALSVIPVTGSDRSEGAFESPPVRWV